MTADPESTVQPWASAVRVQAVIGVYHQRLMISTRHQPHDSEVLLPASGSDNLSPNIYTFRKCIKGRHRPRSARFSKAFLSVLSLTLYALFLVLCLSRLSLMAFRPAACSCPVANSSSRWRDHLRLIAFHPLLVRSLGGLARGVCHYNSSILFISSRRQTC